MAEAILNGDDQTAALHARREQMAGDDAYTQLKREYPDSADGEQQPAIQSRITNEDGSEVKTDAEGNVIRGVVKDVARGITEMPGQIIGGARDAAQETINMWLSAGDWLEKKFPITPGYKPPKEGEPDTRITLPDPVGDATTVTGKITHDVAQFVTGFIGAGKLKAFQAFQPATRAGQFAKASGKGAVADFTVMDPHEKGLSDLVEKYPALSNPVTRFLRADTDDNEAEKRLKKSLEGLGLGAVVEGVTLSLKAMRAARVARSEARVQDPTAAPPSSTAKQELDAVLGGESNGDLFTKVKADVEDSAAKTAGLKPKDVGSTTAPETVEINFARINAPEDVQKTIQQMADWYTTDVRGAARGVRTWEQTKLSATQVNAWDTLLTRRAGDALNAEQSLAARQLWVTSATKLADVAAQAAKFPSEANLVGFRKMLATHHAIQKEVIGARTEAARALNSWKIPAGAEGSFAKQLDSLLETSGGAALTQDMARRVAALASNGSMTREMEAFVEGTAMARTRAAVQQVWINALLTNPATHVVNAVSNWSVIAQQMGERRVAAAISDALGTPGGVAPGEATAMLGAVTSGFRDAMRAAYKMATAGESSFGGANKLDNVDFARSGALSADTFAIASDTPIGKALDVVDAVTRAPGRALATSDEFFKSIGYRIELHAQATRQAAADMAEGLVKPEEIKERIAQIIANPPENIRMEAVDQALYQTFTQQPAAVLKNIADAWQRFPVLGVLTMPFKNTPINLLTYAAERSPMAPLVKQWRDDLAAGGARADVALARVSTGSMVMLAMIDAAMSGHINGKGPSRPQERQNWLRQGNLEYSIRAGDRNYQYSRTDPIGMTIGMAADLAEAVMNGDKQMSQGGSTYNATEEAVISAMFAVAKNVTSKTYMQGVAQFLDAVSDPDRHGERYFQKVASSFLPAVAGTITRQEDPYMRMATNVVEAMQRKSPWHSADLPMYRDLWGRPVDYRSGLGALHDIFSPVNSKEAAAEPIDAEMKRLEFFPSMPEKKVNFNGVVIDLEEYPHAYSRYVELAGNEAKHPAYGMGTKDLLNAIVTGQHPLSRIYALYSDGKDGGKADFLQQILQQQRKHAQQQVLAEFSDVQAEYESKRKPTGNRLNPALFGM